LAMMGVKLHALATWWDVLEAAEKHKYFDKKALEVTRAFLEKPEEWSAAHGGAKMGGSKPRPPAPARS